MMGTAFVVGRSSSRAVAPFAAIIGGIIGFAGLLCAGYGSYAAHELGLWGLDPEDFGSDDMLGQNAILVAIIVFGVPVTLIGAMAGYAGAISGRFHRT